MSVGLSADHTVEWVELGRRNRVMHTIGRDRLQAGDVETTLRLAVEAGVVDQALQVPSARIVDRIGASLEAGRLDADVVALEVQVVLDIGAGDTEQEVRGNREVRTQRDVV